MNKKKLENSAKTNHPPGLYVLCFAAMWDRFSFYGAVALLILYLTKIVLFSDIKANEFYASFIALGFAMPVLGGFLSDKLIGFNKAIKLGIFGIILGNLFLALPNHFFLYLGFAVLTMGMGLFKGNITGLVGTLYEDNDPRRENGFALFYIGMNLGAILGPIIYGFCIEQYGWHYGFVVSALGMLFSGILFFRLKIKNNFQTKKNYFNNYFFYPLLLLIIIFLTSLFYYPFFANKMLGVFALSTFGALLVITFKRNSFERNKMIVLALLCFFSVCYFACNMQIGSSITLFIERYVNREILGINIPTIVFSSLDPFFTIILAPFFMYFWKLLRHYDKEPSVMAKLTLGLIFTSISFLLFALAAKNIKLFGASHPVLLLILGNLFLGAGELVIFPPIMSTFYDYSPPQMLGTLMGMWYLSASLSGYIGSLFTKISNTLDVINISMVDYYHTFLIIAVITFIISLFALSTSPLIKKLVTTD